MYIPRFIVIAKKFLERSSYFFLSNQRDVQFCVKIPFVRFPSSKFKVEKIKEDRTFGSKRQTFKASIKYIFTHSHYDIQQFSSVFQHFDSFCNSMRARIKRSSSRIKKNILNEELCIFNRQLTSCLYIFRVRNIIKHQNIDQYYDALIFRN